MLNKRASGVLLHISSLPSKYGIGCFDECAYAFVDFLKEAGQHYWQILPLCPTTVGDSPYQSISTFALNEYFIDLDALCRLGYLKKEEYEDIKWFEYEDEVDYSLLYTNRHRVLYKAFDRFKRNIPNDFNSFCEQNSYWLDDYALFCAVKDYFGGEPFYYWNEDIKYREELAIDEYINICNERILYYKMLQYFAFSQWLGLKKYAFDNGISIIGDMPIYVAMDSVDVWSNLPMFLIDEKTLKVEKVAGVPPDYFSKDGQLWGNPIYDWDAMEKDNYSWWVSRIGHSLKLYDTVRIDHFRAFASYWAVPAESKTAKIGEWLDGPKMKLFNKIFDAFPNAPIIAEDLGVFGEDVVKLLADTGFPGMKVVQFGFDPNSDSSHMPHNAVPNSINYVGTHDNNTILGWLWEAGEEERKFALEYCGFYGDNWGEGGYYSASCRKIIETVWKSSSNVAIIALQDMCGFGSDARMNIPGVPDKNWRFRTTRDTIDNIDTSYFKHINSLFRRMYPAFDDKKNK